MRKKNCVYIFLSFRKRKNKLFAARIFVQVKKKTNHINVCIRGTVVVRIEKRQDWMRVWQDSIGRLCKLLMASIARWSKETVGCGGRNVRRGDDSSIHLFQI